jgi:hypothetical protein
MQNNNKVVNYTIAMLHSSTIWASQIESDVRSWVLLVFCYTPTFDSFKPLTQKISRHYFLLVFKSMHTRNVT